MEPLSSSQREAGVGGHEKSKCSNNLPIIRNAIDFSEKFKKPVDGGVQSNQRVKSTLKSKKNSGLHAGHSADQQ